MAKKILLINDDESIREILQMYLEIKNYEVCQAWNGEKGLETAKQILPDLILLDVMLPGINGYEVCKKLKNDPATSDIPVLFLSPLLATNEKIKGLECGAVDFINNAADYAEILARIEIHLKIKELNKQLLTTNQELLQKQKILNEDLHAAAMIQKTLLPAQKPVLTNVDVAWTCIPSTLVGGDICSINRLSEDLSAFYILDVSGHGVSSAMVTVSIKQNIQQKQLANTEHSPKQILNSLHQDYPYDYFNMFSTIFYMIFNNKNGRLTYSSAGHPPAVLLSSTRSYRLLENRGGLIGVDSRAPYEDEEVILKDGDKVILYTDGVTEYQNTEGALFGENNFYNLLESVKAFPVEEIIEVVIKSLERFGKGRSSRDDISLLGIEYKVSGVSES